MDITQMETPELIEILKEIPTSLLLRMTYERVVDINIRTEDDEVAMHCENIAEEIHEVVYHFDLEEAKLLRAYQNHMFDAGLSRIIKEKLMGKYYIMVEIEYVDYDNMTKGKMKMRHDFDTPQDNLERPIMSCIKSFYAKTINCDITDITVTDMQCLIKGE